MSLHHLTCLVLLIVMVPLAVASVWGMAVSMKAGSVGSSWGWAVAFLGACLVAASCLRALV